ncbi:SH3 domain-containing protein [Spirillospora sp. CA-108201]
MKKVFLAGAAASTFTVAGLGLSGSASATPTTTPSTATTASCKYYMQAKDAIKIRATPNLTATALGVLPKGEKVCSDEYRYGGKYVYTGSCKTKADGDNRWDHITYKTIKGWVPTTCMNLL